MNSKYSRRDAPVGRLSMQERLQKILSARGLCSRRKAEEYIEAGLVTVNGEVATLGQKADPDTDDIQVDGKIIEDRKDMMYYLLSKPKGVETTNLDGRDGKKTVKDLLPATLKDIIYPVGRLDKDTTGLLLLTNDGVLAYRLTHPKFDHEKEYIVTVAHDIKEGQLEKLRKGITISGEKTKKASAEQVGKKQLQITLTEGKNRQIRRMCQKVGLPVVELRRVRIMTLSDDTLQDGSIRELRQEEREALLRSIDV